MKYYLITQTEDGLHVREGTAEEAKRMITEEPSYYFFDHLPDISQGYFLEGRITEGSPGTAALLIRGDIVVPQAKVVVTEYII